MDTHIIALVAAAFGSMVGAASVTTTWMNQRKQTIREPSWIDAA
jgi:hypothetical protein